MEHAPAFLKLVEDARRNVTEISIRDVLTRLSLGEEFVLVDVREESEFAAGHIRGARHIGKGVLERDIESRVPDKDAEVVLYCGGGFRSVLAAEALQKMGYTRVKSMADGWRGWRAAQGPTE